MKVLERQTYFPHIPHPDKNKAFRDLYKIIEKKFSDTYDEFLNSISIDKFYFHNLTSTSEISDFVIECGYGFESNTYNLSESWATSIAPIYVKDCTLLSSGGEYNQVQVSFGVGSYGYWIVMRPRT